MGRHETLSKRRRQQVFLALLVTVFVVLAGRQLRSQFSGGGYEGAASRSSAGGRTELGSWREEIPEVEDLQLDALEVGSEILGEGRDPFQLRRPEPAPRQDSNAAAASQAIEKARQRQVTQILQPVQPARPVPPPIDVVFLGSFGSERHRLAVFSDGNEIFNVPEGDVLKDKFVVVRIGFESADLGFVGFPEAPARRLEIGG